MKNGLILEMKAIGVQLQSNLEKLQASNVKVKITIVIKPCNPRCRRRWSLARRAMTS